MKKILLIIFTIILILSVNVLAVDIDIGMPAVNRGTTMDDYTIVNMGNPAEESGKITSVEIWANETMTVCEVAIFFVVSGNFLSTRDIHYIGEVIAGSKQTFVVDLNVEAGDYIGLVTGPENIEYDASGFDGVWRLSGDHIPCANVEFSVGSGDAVSLYGTGTTAVGWAHKWNTQTISKWNNKEFTKWNGLE